MTRPDFPIFGRCTAPQGSMAIRAHLIRRKLPRSTATRAPGARAGDNGDLLPLEIGPRPGVKKDREKNKERYANARKNRKNLSKMRPDFPGGLANITSRQLGVHRAVPVRRAGLLDRDFREQSAPAALPLLQGTA